MLAALALLAGVTAAQPDPPADPPPPEPVVVVEEGAVESAVIDRRPFLDRPLGRWWLDPSVEFGWTNDRPAPQAVRLNPPAAFGGVSRLALPVGDRAADRFRIGFAMTAGKWFGDADQYAVEAGVYFLPGMTREFTGTATGALVLFPNGPDRSAPLFLNLPDGLGWAATPFPATASTTYVTTDINLRPNLLRGAAGQLDLIAGYRFAYLDDELHLGRTPDNGADGNHDPSDAFRHNRLLVANQFHGGQLGLAGWLRTSTVYVDGTVKVAYGGISTRGEASGAFRSADPAVRCLCGTRGAVLPVVNLRVGCRLGESVDVFTGYSFQYLTGVGRLGDAFTGGRGEFWTQSVGLGLGVWY